MAFRLMKPFPTAIPISVLNHNKNNSKLLSASLIYLSQYTTRNYCTVSAAAAQSSALEKVRYKIVGQFRKKLKIVDIKGQGLNRLGEILVVRSWVRTLRAQSTVTFIEVSDGSCISNMQCVVGSDAEDYDQVESSSISTGASVWVQGTVVASQGSKQKIELKVLKLVLVGKSDPSFPIQKKKVSREFLRTKAHLRPRTNTFSAVSRVRSALAYATHKFFNENGFVWVSTPIITASDCEGAGEQFCVTTLVPSSSKTTNTPGSDTPSVFLQASQVYNFDSHRDLKPSNVLLGEDMVAHVSDFGMSKLSGIGRHEHAH